LVELIVRRLNIGPNDFVYEIGPGRGMITRELAKTAGKVVAVEIDPRLCLHLQVEFTANPQVKIINADWLNYRVPESNYKVFANIPFNLTAKIVNRLVTDRKFMEAFLVVQKEAAEKFTGTPKSTQWSVLNQPWFELQILYRFKRVDFFPRPSVKIVLLKISRRQKALVKAKDKGDYYRLVLQGFNNWRRLSRELKFPLHVRPGDLTFPQWLGIFKFHLTHK